MSVLDQFQEAQNQVLHRIEQLEPLVKEYEELKRIVERLDADGPILAPTAAETRARRRTASTRSDGGRRDDIQRIVTESPGVTINHLGKTLGVDPTGLYRPVRALVADGLIHKQGPNLYPQSVANLHTSGYVRPEAA